MIPAVFAGVLLLSGCNKFLDESNPSNYTIDRYFTRAEHAQASIDAIYGPLRDIPGGGFGGAAWTMTEFATGLASTDLGQAVNSYYVKDLKNTAENGYGTSYWRAYYAGIANANLSLEKIPGITMDETLKKRLMGEAYFLRAWYYFTLVRLFGHIPLLTKPILSTEDPEFKPKQANPEDVYKQVVEDLKTAEAAGLPWTSKEGRVSLGAVKSLLANVYLTMAGYPLQKGKEYYSLAAGKAEEVINSGQFKLFASYNDLHDPAKKNIDENIFMIQYKTGVIPGNWQDLIIPYNKGISAYSAETGGIYATPDFVKSFEPGDYRTAEKQFFFTEYTDEKDRKKNVALGGYFIYKLLDSVAQVSSANSDLNYGIIRYADVLLTYAEASNEGAGPSTKAYEAVNAIRTRAKLAPLAGLSQDAFREAIWRERWFELCYENKTWFDMVRTRKVFNVGTRKFDDFVGHKFSYGPVLTERELLFPIPSTDVLNNTNLQQNKGY
ncbi:RagB/SusD family nutrient uptake outer membrane protein [Sphingobacterium sp. CZ-UAM]|nr:RagB/SusD family nutrient uptake outer membrane protein [Sphingobacterium sp. CZ-UAM]